MILKSEVCTMSWVTVIFERLRQQKTAVKREVAECARLEREVVERCAREQRRIAYDLHDGVGQQLAGIALSAKLLEEQLRPDRPAQAEKASAIVRLAKEAARQTRLTARGLEGDDGVGDLKAALESLAMNISENCCVKSTVKANGTPLPGSAPVAAQLYRIAQEAVRNAVEHGGAHEVLIQLTFGHQDILLTIQDDGEGFDTKTNGDGMGLRIMRYRAQSIGGSCEVHTGANKGTTVYCRVPLQSAVVPSYNLMNATGPTKEKSPVIVVEDHPLLCDGLKQLIDNQPDLACVGVSDDIPGAKRLVEECKPHLIVLDLRLKGGDTFDFIKKLRVEAPELKVLVLSQYDELIFAERALRAGASGYIMKENSADEVLRALRKVLAGELYFSERVAAAVVQRTLREKSDSPHVGVERLSDREMQVFKLLGGAYSPREIAEQFHLSRKTVETHCENIKHKLSFGTAGELKRFARRWATENPTVSETWVVSSPQNGPSGSNEVSAAVNRDSSP